MSTSYDVHNNTGPTAHYMGTSQINTLSSDLYRKKYNSLKICIAVRINLTNNNAFQCVLGDEDRL